MKIDEKNKKIIVIGVIVVVIAIIAFVMLRQPEQPRAPALTGITVSPATATVIVGGTQNFRATAYPADAVMGAVTFSVVDERVGTINPVTGVFTAVAAGTTNITATYGDVTTTVAVTVTAPVIPEPEPEYPLE